MAFRRNTHPILSLPLLAALVAIAASANHARCADMAASRLAMTSADPAPLAAGMPPVIVNRWVDCTVFGSRLAAHFGALYLRDLRAEVTDPNGLSDIILVTATAPDGPIYKLYDDGTHGDMAPGDGIFQARWLAATPTPAGDYFFFADDSRTLTDSSWATLYPESEFPFPSVPAPVSPLHGAIVTTTTPRLSWQSSVNASEGYEVLIWDGLPAGTDWDWGHVVWRAEGLTGTSILVPAGILQPGQTYHWWVAARNQDPVEGNSRYAAEYASFAVKALVAIAGQVRVRGTSTNIAGATVTAYLAGVAKGSAVTGANGLYSIPGLASGTYAVTARKSGYCAQTKTNVTVTASQTTYVNFSLEVSGKLKGQVKDKVSGAPIIGATVVARKDGIIRASAVTTAPYGVYQMTSNLPAGAYVIGASKAGYLGQTRKDIPVAAGTTTYVNFNLYYPAYSAE